MAAPLDLDGPALAAPPGYTSNLDNPPNNNELAWIVDIFCIVFSTLCVCIRLYERGIIARKIQVEEVLIIIAYGMYWGTAYPALALIESPGYFKHQWDARLRELIPAAYWTFIFGICYSFVLPCLKTAILIEWCRIFVPRGTRTKSYFWWGAVVVIVIQVGAALAVIIALNLQCTPHAGIWDFTIPERKCFPLYNLQVTSATIQLASDVAIFLLPQRVIWELQMSWQKKLGISIIFGMGLLACVSAAARLATTVIHGNADDQIYTLAPLVLWLMGEMGCGFFVACVASIPKIIKETKCLKRFKRVFGMTTNSQSVKPTEGSANYGKMSTTTSAYHKLDEDTIPMGNMKRSESTEYLHQAPAGSTIVRTTRITVTQDSHPASNTGNGNVHKDAWGM